MNQIVQRLSIGIEIYVQRVMVNVKLSVDSLIGWLDLEPESPDHK